VTLSWVLPWYVLWVLPMAALSALARLRGRRWCSASTDARVGSVGGLSVGTRSGFSPV